MFPDGDANDAGPLATGWTVVVGGGVTVTVTGGAAVTVTVVVGAGADTVSAGVYVTVWTAVGPGDDEHPAKANAASAKSHAWVFTVMRQGSGDALGDFLRRFEVVTVEARQGPSLGCAPWLLTSCRSGSR